MATVLNNAGNIIPNLSSYSFTWSVADSNGVAFTQFVSKQTVMTINYNLLKPNDIYTVCIRVDNSATQELGQSCSKYQTLSTSNKFAFSVTPSTGFAFNTQFQFTIANTQTLSNQYFYEYGYVYLTVNSSNNAVLDRTFVPYLSNS